MATHPSAKKIPANVTPAEWLTGRDDGRGVTTKASAERRIVELIMSRSGEDRAYQRALKTARAGSGRGEKAPPAYRAGAMLAQAVAVRWLAADEISAMAFAFTGQTDPRLRHGDDGITLKTPKGGKR